MRLQAASVSRRPGEQDILHKRTQKQAPVPTRKSSRWILRGHATVVSATAVKERQATTSDAVKLRDTVKQKLESELNSRLGSIPL